nr:putative wall-associated receptor kinase-like 16 [Ipomoea batatas]
MMRFLVLLLVLFFAPTATSISIAKPKCDDRCGNVSIPFPYGLTQDCYLNPDFLITCNTSYHPPKPFLTDSDVEVKDISVKEHQVIIMKRVNSICYEKGERQSRLKQGYESGSLKLYVNQNANKFVAFGCDTYAYVDGYGDDKSYKMEGCMASCVGIQEVTNGTCGGTGCCETEIPNVARNVYVSLDSINYYNNTADDVNRCSYALVVKRDEFNFSSTMLTKGWDVEKVPMVLDWTIPAEKTPWQTACKENTTYVPLFNSKEYRCACKEGYEGNPYLSGCQGMHVITL